MPKYGFDVKFTVEADDEESANLLVDKALAGFEVESNPGPDLIDEEPIEDEDDDDTNV
jgi:hypothetical protein